MSHTVLVEITCVTGKGSEFLQAMLPMLADTRAFEGCELVETFTDQDNPDVVLLWEKWASRKNQEAYITWRSETGTLAEMSRKYMTGDPRFVHLSSAD